MMCTRCRYTMIPVYPTPSPLPCPSPSPSPFTLSLTLPELFKPTQMQNVPISNQYQRTHSAILETCSCEHTQICHLYLAGAANCSTRVILTCLGLTSRSTSMHREGPRKHLRNLIAPPTTSSGLNRFGKIMSKRPGCT